MIPERQKRFDSAQKLFARALDSSSPAEQRIAVRKLIQMMLAGHWAPHEVILMQASSGPCTTEISRLYTVIDEMEKTIRKKDGRILELAAALHQERTHPRSNEWKVQVNEFQVVLHSMEQKFGFGATMRAAINDWYIHLPMDDRGPAREAGRNWLRQHKGWEKARMIADDHRLRWRRAG